MKTNFLLKAAAIFVLTSNLLAQSKDAAPQIDYEARAKSVVTLKAHIAQREARFEALKKDLLALDARVEERVDYLVKTLSALKDSNDSKTRITNLKGDVIDGLRRSISIYRQKRVAIFERQRKEQIVPEAELAANIDAFDRRIGKRIEQIMELVRSLPGHQEVPKYESDGGSYYADGWYEETSRISDDWKQNRRQSAKSDSERRDLLKDIEKSISTADSRRRALADTLAKGKLAEKDRTLRQQELGRTDALLDNLKQRRRELALPGDASGRELGMSEASDIEKMITDSREDVSRDAWEIFRKYDDLDKERTRLRALEQNLKAREEWLKNNPQPNK